MSIITLILVISHFYILADAVGTDASDCVCSHGDGNAPLEVVARTFSDVPSAAPANVRAEPASSRSLIIRWEQPPLQEQNGQCRNWGQHS